jgi:transposase InsO family protein
VFIPQQGREAVLQELHEGHPGISKMKAMARMYIWWPGIDSEIEKAVRLCGDCQEVQSSPPPAPLNPWKWPTRPWSRLHLDFAGPFEHKMFLILIDAHSKWIEAFSVSNATSQTVITQLRTVFARFGIPEMIVTDNGSCFVSEEFEAYLVQNGIKHTT